ncbi:phage tail protein [Bacillus pseudomycoides]|uniref:phage tail sheath family protein n=1 Tax=Bacillus pseudomycoides TaxID=64104 RepID=UPI000BEC21D7|nr:phage tail sheath family protein [Bacillus pseudomycoides]MBD5799856.1 phage tail protein [Bacillus pseudomycoides]PDZ13441.1 phage tail protein [Bacillus pseudomycoides]PEO83565.1 phage tail protein [Bacillus pseudomycoides]
MPEYLSPGVYMEEVEIGSKPIEGVSTSTVGVLGETERGPTTPTFITSFLEYQRIYGSYFGENKYLPYAVQGFFENGGQRCYVGRIVKDKTSSSKKNLTKKGKDVLTVEAIGEGEWGNRIAVKITKGTIDGFKLSVFYWKSRLTALYDPDTDFITTPRPAVTEVFDNLTVIEDSPDFYGKKVNGISNLIRLSAHGNNLEKPEPDNDNKHTGQVQEADENTITLSADADSTNNAYKDMLITITEGEGKGQVKRIQSYEGSTKKVTLYGKWSTIPEKGKSKYKVSYKSLSFLTGGNDVSTIMTGKVQSNDNIGANTIKLGAEDKLQSIKEKMQIHITSGPGKGQKKTIIEIDKDAKVLTIDEDWDSPKPDAQSEYHIIDGNISLNDYLQEVSDKPGERKGLTAFKAIDDISIVYSPNAKDVDGLIDKLITHCETLKDRFVIIDSPLDYKDIKNLDPRNSLITGSRDTKYAAFYYPGIKVVDPELGKVKTIPPGGHIAGIYARTDTERGVHKAPANEIVRGAVDLEFQITKSEQDLLNPRGVNVIRSFPRGIYVWGARTVSTNPLWKYINVRRLFNFIEESIEEGTQWVVFEPNDEKLWARVKLSITEFLTRVWRDGALMGSKPEEAFFVKIDRTTMTQNDIDNGKLIALIGIAPVKPAEFVIFRIAQVPSGSKISED